MIEKNYKLIPLGDIPYYLGPHDTVCKCTGKQLIPQGGRFRFRIGGRYEMHTLSYIKLITQETEHGHKET